MQSSSLQYQVIEELNEQEQEQEEEISDEEESVEQQPLPEQRTFEQLLIERMEFEERLYNTLIGNINGVYLYRSVVIENEIQPHSDHPFWDPVIVSLSQEQIGLLETIELQEEIECLICKENETVFKKVVCCNNKLCLDCIFTWFNKSVFCPFCKHDQRETVDQRETTVATQRENDII